MDYPIERNLDCVYFRMKRYDKWCNVCFTDLTEEEQDKVMEGRNDEWLKSMCKILARYLRIVGDEFDIVCE